MAQRRIRLATWDHLKVPRRTVTLAFASLLVALAVVGGAPAAPPPGLSAQGRLLWNLDALLHDRFGKHPVYVNFADPYGRPDSFSTKFISEASSGWYTYTFANARGSAFRVEHPTRPPKFEPWNKGARIPMMLGGGFISCGRGTWVFMETGHVGFNAEWSCTR